MKKTINILGAAAMLCALSMPATSSNAGDYPTAINSRPLTLPGGAWQARGAFVAGADFERTGLRVEADYAINNELQLSLTNVGAAFTPDFAINEGLGLGVAYSVHNSGPLSIAATLGLPISFAEGTDPVSTVGLGAMTRYNLMDGKLSLYTGDGLLGINFGGDDLVAMINLPLGIAYQVNDNINVRLNTALATIPLTGGDVVSIADVTPFELWFAYSTDNKMDVGLWLAGDAQDFGDTLSLGVGVQYRGL